MVTTWVRNTRSWRHSRGATRQLACFRYFIEVCRETGHLRAGVEYATPYLRLHPGDFPLRYRVAALLYALGQYDQARSELDHVLDMAPNYGPAHELLAITSR